MKDKFSIIIPIYNAELTLKRCLDSITRQTYRKFEAILIDDGSKDTSLSIAKEFAKNDPRFIVFHQENNGVSSARKDIWKNQKLLTQLCSDFYKNECKNLYDKAKSFFWFHGISISINTATSYHWSRTEYLVLCEEIVSHPKFLEIKKLNSKYKNLVMMLLKNRFFYDIKIYFDNEKYVCLLSKESK